MTYLVWERILRESIQGKEKRNGIGQHLTQSQKSGMYVQKVTLYCLIHSTAMESLLLLLRERCVMGVTNPYSFQNIRDTLMRMFRKNKIQSGK